MLTVSDRFLAALRETHTISVAARVYRPSAPTVPIDVPVLGGSVTIDSDAQVRRQATLETTFTLDDAFSRDVVRELPFGGKAVIERGIRYADGEIERVQLGRFRVESVVWGELQGRATLTLADHMAQIQDERFTVPCVPAGKPSSACAVLVGEVFGATIAFHTETDPPSEPDLHDTVYEEDRAQALNDLASSVDAVIFFDHLGDCVIRPRQRATSVVWTLDAGARGVLIAASETLDRSAVRNGVVVRGQVQADQPPLIALATNNDPHSLTRWGGPFGKVPLISSSTAVGSQAAADKTAASLLNLRLGLQRTVTLVGVPNPALEPDDKIELVFADGRAEQHTINSMRIGLDPAGALELTTAGQYNPALASRHTGLFAGEAAWRELEDADLAAIR